MEHTVSLVERLFPVVVKSRCFILVILLPVDRRSLLSHLSLVTKHIRDNLSCWHGGHRSGRIMVPPEVLRLVGDTGKPTIRDRSVSREVCRVATVAQDGWVNSEGSIRHDFWREDIRGPFQRGKWEEDQRSEQKR